MRYSFVKDTLVRLIQDGILATGDSVLAVAGGHAENQLFRDLNFRDVTISNLDDRMTGDEFAPLSWSYQDAHDLTYADKQFDFAFVSDGLHHCHSPHRALTEMYRVARKGVIVFESRDSLLMRLANRLHLTPSYELEAVVGNDFTFGGVDNTDIPNYIFRWTEREFQKTIRSYDPIGRHTFRFYYGLNLPYEQAEMKKSKVKALAVRLLDPLVKLATTIAKRQCNSFCMVALRPDPARDLWPWLTGDEERITFDRGYASEIFKV